MGDVIHLANHRAVRELARQTVAAAVAEEQEREQSGGELAAYVALVYRTTREQRDHRDALIATVAALLEDAYEQAAEDGDLSAVREMARRLRRTL